MISKFRPEINKVYFINHYTMFQILDGSGAIQVDFNNYLDWSDKLIFLEKGQYIKFLSDSFLVRKIIFDDSEMFRNENMRVLFKHLISLGYINYQECEKCQKYLNDTLFTSTKNIIDTSVNQWFWQNPFNASQEEYQIIFDLKEMIDEHFNNQLSVTELTNSLKRSNKQVHVLLKDKVGLTVKNLLTNKRVKEGRKKIAFSGQSIKSIAYDLGYNDPAYFNRVFKKSTGITPNEYRDQIGYELEDPFEQELFDLIKEFHASHKETAFYADKMFMSGKTLSKKVRKRLNMSIGQLIRYQILSSAKKYLDQGFRVKDTAFELGFEEPNHFSSFFKHYTNLTPSQYISKKSNQ